LSPIVIQKNCGNKTVPGGTGVRVAGQAQAAYSAPVVVSKMETNKDGVSIAEWELAGLYPLSREVPNVDAAVAEIIGSSVWLLTNPR
jgi:hypothetical protein